MKSGKLVSDSLINAMVHDWFETIIKQEDNIILDGFPRTVGQAQALHEFLKKSSWVCECTSCAFFNF